MTQLNNVTQEDMSTLPYILAVDFDGTLVEDRYPEIGEPIDWVWKELSDRKNLDQKIILWTCRDGEHLKAAVQFCIEHGLHFDAINDNLDEVKVMFNNDTRKVFANEYWDDKALPNYFSKNTLTDPNFWSDC
ncbi:MAG: hypothetical protein RR490_08125 [Niameybacter sp.]